MSSIPRSITRFVNDRPSAHTQASRWLRAIYVSLALWLAMAVGNSALFAVRPANHWPVLEAIEAWQVASLIPVALLLHRVNRRSRASRVVTLVGIAAMIVAVAIDVGFVTGMIAFGVGPVGGPIFIADFLAVLVWLAGANALAWQGATLPRGTALTGILTAITATLLYPAWASQLARALTDPTPAHSKAACAGDEMA